MARALLLPILLLGTPLECESSGTGSWSASPQRLPAEPDVTEQRSRALLLNHIAHSWPKCETGAHWGQGSACWEVHFFCIMANAFPNATAPGAAIATSNATRTHGTNLSFANSEIRRLVQDQVPANGAVGIPYYSVVPLGLRLYFRAAPSSLLEPATRQALEDLAMRWLSYRSFAARGLGSVQSIDGSENHDMLRKASYLLAAQVLVTCGRGGERIPSDNQTAAAHLAAWESFFVRYFR